MFEILPTDQIDFIQAERRGPKSPIVATHCFQYFPQLNQEKVLAVFKEAFTAKMLYLDYFGFVAMLSTWRFGSVGK